MKKRYKHLGNLLMIVCLLLSSVGCNKSFLDSKPTDILTEDLLFSDEAAYNTHLAFLYSSMPFETFSLWLSYYTDEMVNCTQDQNASVVPADDWWVEGYKLIRDLNHMIDKVPTSTIFSDDVKKTEALGELKFLRAYAYFNLAIRYGGVPIVTEVKELPASSDVTELYQPRDKESDVFKFIETEMDAAIGMMSTQTSFTEYRINKWSALAFKSRAMLYAAAEAKYGELQLDGTVGIPPTEANHYWTSASDAAKQVIQSGQYALYNESDDKVANYHSAFFDESPTNKERIFVVSYVWPLKTHSFDRDAAPFNHRSGEGYGGRFCPIFDMAESYEYIDNTNGALKLSANGLPIAYGNPADLFKNKDPRFFASVLFPGSPWKGTNLEIYAQVIAGGQKIDGHGVDGIAQPEATSTGLYLSKWQDPAPPRPINGSSSDVDRLCIRYAEVLLNLAEADLELNNEPEARMYVNLIRQRAGISQYTTSITMDDYRHERKIELAYEGNRYWDLKRWRTYDKVVYNRDTYALWPIFNQDKNEYTFEKHMLPSGKFTRTFTRSMYYNMIPTAIIQTNPLIVQNPGY